MSEDGQPTEAPAVTDAAAEPTEAPTAKPSTEADAPAATPPADAEMTPAAAATDAPAGRDAKARDTGAKAAEPAEATETPTDQAATADPAKPAEEPPPTRRVRRTASTAERIATRAEEHTEEEAGAPTMEDRPSRRRAETRRRRTTGDRDEPGRSRRRRTTGEPTTRGGDTPERAAKAAPPKRRDAGPPAPSKTTPASAAAIKKEQEKITLILHPAPKAAPTRRKKADRPLTAKEALKAKAEKRAAGRTKETKKAAAEAPTDAPLSAEWLAATDANAMECLEAAQDRATGLIQAWLEQTNAAAIAVAAHQADQLPAAARKAARRALNVLKSRGIDIPTVADEGGGGSVEQEPDPFMASFVPPDAHGNVFFSISQRQPGGRYRVADIVTRDGAGIVHASSGRLAGKRIRQWRSRVENSLGTVPVDVPVPWARHRIAEARKQNDTSTQVLPLGLDTCAPMVEPIPKQPPDHPVADLDQDWTDTEVDGAREASEGLHAQPEFRTWLPDQEAAQELLRQVGVKLGEVGTEDRDAVDKALEEEMAAAADRHFTPEMRTTLADRMRDSAISVRQRAGDADARTVLAVAKAIREAGLITSPPHEVPFLLGFFRKYLALEAQRGDGQLRVPIPQPPPDAKAAEPEK